MSLTFVVSYYLLVAVSQSKNYQPSGYPENLVTAVVDDRVKVYLPAQVSHKLSFEKEEQTVLKRKILYSK